MIVAKFGGTSVSSKERILTLCNIVKNELERQPVVVVSALSGVTDLLLSGGSIREIRKLHKDLIESLWSKKELQKEVLEFIDSQLEKVAKLRNQELDKASLDKLASYGEIMSSYIITKALVSQGIKAVQVIATELIVTDNNFGASEFLVKPTQRKIKKILGPIIKSQAVPVVTGFIGSTKQGQVTTLGRGGSDYTASIIGFCLKASEIQIWTDVDGIFTSDPRLIENARSLSAVSFKEAAELAAFGARVLHPKSIHPAISAGIPVKVLNTFNPENPGTLIKETNEQPGKIKAVSFKRQISLVNLYATEMLLKKGFLARIFKIFADHNLSVDLVSVSEVSISVSLDNKDNLENVLKELSKFANVTVSEDAGMVSLIGEGIASDTKTVRRVFDILDKEKILARMVSLSAANINISIVVDSNKVEDTVKALHNKLLVNDRINS